MCQFSLSEWTCASLATHMPRVYGQHKLDTIGLKRKTEHKVRWVGKESESTLGEYDLNTLHEILKELIKEYYRGYHIK